MKLWEIVVILVAANAVAAVLMLALRRRTPTDGRIRDSSATRCDADGRPLSPS